MTTPAPTQQQQQVHTVAQRAAAVAINPHQIRVYLFTATHTDTTAHTHIQRASHSHLQETAMATEIVAEE